MNKYFRALVVIPCGALKMIWTKIFHLRRFSGPLLCQTFPFTEISLDRKGELSVGKGFKMRDGAKIRVRNGAECRIGDNASISSNSIVTCREAITIGSGCQISPNVQIYDHDHDFRDEGGIGTMKYKSSPVKIGDNVWIGANTVILRGTQIGNNCVTGAGCIVKGEYPDNSVIIQKKNNNSNVIEENNTMDKPIRILHMIGSLNIGGSQAMILNIYRKIDRTKVQFDFIIDHSGHTYYKEEVETLGAVVYEFPTFTGKNIIQIKRFWNDFFTNHTEYKIFHSHVRSYASVFIPIAKKYGLKTIIHSHSTSNGKGITGLVKNIIQFPVRYQADYLFACSDKAGKWMFGKKVINKENYRVIPNAINAGRFGYDIQKRNEIRQKLQIEDKHVIGTVGRLSEPKNHKFLIEVFKEINKQNSETVLLLVGDGELREQLEKQVDEYDLKDKVIFLGNVGDTQNYYQAMDVFAFPSLWEGLGIVALEAQCSGLHCVVSENIPAEINLVDDLVHVVSLSNMKDWTKELLLKHERSDMSYAIKDSGYDINNSISWIQNFYQELWRGN